MKKCTICDEPAKYAIKGSAEFYCEDCAKEHFGDISYLITVEQQALELKKIVDEQIGILADELSDINDESETEDKKENN